MTKIDIFSGFLGAGKTTLIKKLIKEAFKGEKLVLIENEFGEIGIDGGFLKDSGIQINEMISGCICCSLVGDFTKALKETVDTYSPDRIIIEPSGVGKLSDVIAAVNNTGDENIIVDSCVTVVDCTKAKTELGYTTRSYEETIHDEVQWMIAEGLIDGNGVTEKPTLMTNEQIREGGYMEDIIKAMEHEPGLPAIDGEKLYQTIEAGTVGAYRKVEDTVVSGYKQVEQGAVSGFRRVSDFFIKKLFSRKGETVEETRMRLSRK